MIRSTRCFLYAMDSLLALRNGEVMWPSPPFFLPRRVFVVVMAACRSCRSLLPSFFMSSGALRRRTRLHPDTFADFIPVEGRSVKGSLRRWHRFSLVVESIGNVAEEVFDRTVARAMRCVGRRKIEDARW